MAVCSSKSRVIGGCGSRFSVVLVSIRVGFVSKVSTTRRVHGVSDRIIVVFVAGVTRCTVENCTMSTLSCMLGPMSCFTFSRELGHTVRHVGGQRTGIVVMGVGNNVIHVGVTGVCCVRDRKRALVLRAVLKSCRAAKGVGRVSRGLSKVGFYEKGGKCLVGLRRMSQVRSGYTMMGNRRLILDHTHGGRFVRTLAEC